ncbi:MAG: GNAT family N-acetyltransferase [Defluviitaleaceae bacterium]|nr:GNAT family N-acetyltransferase [Defluviitaleaceae bacterium]
MEIARAEIHDLPDILSLQHLAYQSEAELVGDYLIPPLTQTLEGITEDFKNGLILKVVENNEIIGSVRMRFFENTLYIGRLIVAPTNQNQGIGTALLLAVEELYPDVRLELFTSDKSNKNLSLYTKNGYKEFKRKKLNENINFVYLEKYRKH